MTLAKQVQSEWPKVKVLYMSAHPAEILAQQGLSALDVPFLAKPYTRDELLGKIREALDRRSSARRTSSLFTQSPPASHSR